MSRTKQSLAAEAKFLGIVTEKGGKALTPYISARDKVTIACANGHTFEISPHHANSDGQWCPRCPNKLTQEILTGFQYRVSQKRGLIINPCSKATHLATIQCERGHQWNATPTSIYKTEAWCPECERIAGTTYEMKVRATIQYRDGTLLNEYQNNGKHKLQIRCEQGHIFETTPSSIVVGNWCKECLTSNGTKENLEAIIKNKNGTLLTPYINSRTTVSVRCSAGHVWNPYPGNIVLHDSWCPQCPKSTTINAERRFREEVHRRGGKVLTTYTGIHDIITLACSNNHGFSVEPNSIMSMGTWCPKCSGNCPKQAAENFYARVLQLRGKLHGAYTHAYGDATVECEFGHTWDAVPHNVMSNGNWCPVCKESHGERTVRNILTKHNIPFTPQKEHPSLLGRRYDFYFNHSNKEFYLEFDGEQHFRRIEFFCKTEEIFQYRRDIDVLKSHTVITNNSYLIRLDFTLTEEEIESHIFKAIQGNEKLYVSNPEMYEWILTGINIHPIPITLNIMIPPQIRIPPIHLTLKIVKSEISSPISQN